MRPFLIYTFIAFTSLYLPALGATKISAISPTRIPFGKDSTIIVSGSGLKSIKGCAVLPVTSDVSSATVPIANTCTAHPNKSGTQLIVTVAGNGLKVTGAYNLALTTVPVTTNSNLYDDKGVSTIVLVDQIYAYSPTPLSTAPSTTNGGIDGTIHPYTDCIGQSDGPRSVGNQNIPSTTILCGSSIMPDAEVSDNFGFHVSQLYSAIQVRVSNKNSQYDFLLRDIVLTLPDGRVISSRIRRFAQGVAVKGKTHDRRSIWFNSLTAAGGVYGALASFGSAGFTTAGNVLQGAFMSSFNQIFPDYTADNVNRFNNAVFDDQNPSIVPKDSIGQPPLYVLALVPKEPGSSKDAAYEKAKNVIVSIEGTYIKQVNLLSLSKSTLSFQPQFISPAALVTNPPLDFTDLTSLSESQQFSVTNTGSAAMNIHGFKIVPSGTSQNIASPDFDIDTGKSNCGIGGGTVAPSTGSTAFSLSPNASCVISVRFHPSTIGQVNATLVLDADNLEGPSSVPLAGTGVGLVMQAFDSATTAHTFGKCSYSIPSSCTFDLGSQNGTAALVNVYYFTESPKDQLTATTATTPSSVKSFTSLGAVPVAGTQMPTPAILSVPITPTETSTAVSLLDSAGNFKPQTPLIITFHYQTVATNLNTSAITAALPLPAKPAVIVSRKEGLGTPVGSVHYVVTKQNALPSTPAVVPDASVTAAADGTAVIDLSALVPGKYTITLHFIGTGVYQNTISESKDFTIPAALSIVFGSPANLVHGSPVVIPISASAVPSATCTGTFTSTVTLGGVPATFTPSIGNNGTGSLTITQTTVGVYTVVVTYVPDPSSPCVATTNSESVVVP